MTSLDAPIVGVTVYPDRARVVRRGRLRLAPGEHQVVIAPLPVLLQPESVRVTGLGPATVLGVDVARQHPARTGDEALAQLEEQLRVAQAAAAAIADQDLVAGHREEFLVRLGGRASGTFARALATGGADAQAVSTFADANAQAQTEVRRARRELADQLQRAQEQVDAAQRALDARARQRDPDHLAATIALLVTGDGVTGDGVTGDGVTGDGGAAEELALELSYVVLGAGWRSAYDLRLAGTAGTMLTLHWYGLVQQTTGEDWPECDLRLSTARPSGAVQVPELMPWYLDRIRPRVMAAPAPQPAVLAARAMAMTESAVPAFADDLARVEQGATAATYTPSRPVAVPADGATHRAALAVLELEAALDYITAPVRNAEAHLRATVTNTSAHTVPAGSASVFHAGDFVGSSALDLWAPGEEIELALGVDDRIRVERELRRRTATKPMLSSTRRLEAEHVTTVANHTPGPVKVTVLDQLPVSRDDGITVQQTRIEPAPAERTDLGILTWVLELAPGESRTITLGVRVELAKGVELAGWRE